MNTGDYNIIKCIPILGNIEKRLERQWEFLFYQNSTISYIPYRSNG